jgi:dTDP-D-glucose 4,6-dehydratase
MFGYSPRFRTDLVVNTMIKSALTRSEINVVGNGEQWRPHIHVNDLARIIAFLLLNNKKRCETYNLVHFNLTVEQLAIILQSLLYENFDRIIKINYSDENMLDKRNYNISGKKFIDDFGIDFPYGIIFMNNILSGAKEIINEWDKGIIDFNNPIYNNVEWLGEIDLEERF